MEQVIKEGKFKSFIFGKYSKVVNYNDSIITMTDALIETSLALEILEHELEIKHKTEIEYIDLSQLVTTPEVNMEELEDKECDVIIESDSNIDEFGNKIITGNYLFDFEEIDNNSDYQMVFVWRYCGEEKWRYLCGNTRIKSGEQPTYEQIEQLKNSAWNLLEKRKFCNTDTISFILWNPIVKKESEETAQRDIFAAIHPKHKPYTLKKRPKN